MKRNIAGHVIVAILSILTGSEVCSKTYDRKEAVQYALKWSSSDEKIRNQEYPIYDSNNRVFDTNDCINFVSQALRAGGWVDSPDDTIPWFHSGSTSKRQYSSSWILVKKYYERMKGKYENVEFVYGLDNIYASKILRPGDIVFEKSYNSTTKTYSVRAHHAMMITSTTKRNQYGYPDIGVSAHTNERHDQSLRGIINEALASNDIVYLNDGNGNKIMSEMFVAVHIKDQPKALASIQSVEIIPDETKIARNVVRGFADKLLALLGIRNALAQTIRLVAYTNSWYTVRVTGTGLDGYELIDIDGSVCDSSTVTAGSGFFTQRCVGGSTASRTYKIRASDSLYEADLSIPIAYQEMELIGPVLSPLPPTLTDLGSGVIHLYWSAVSGASGYKISRDGTDIATLGATTAYDDAGRTPGVKTCYRVRTLANGVMSAYSSESCITPVAPQCANQWNSGSTPIGASESTVQSCPAGQTGSISLYHICQASGSSAAWSGTSTTNTCVTPPLPAPAGFAAAQYRQGTTKGIRLNWNAVSGADSYLVYKLGVNGLYAPLGNQTSFIDTLNLRSRSSYCYTVRAQSGNRVSVDSDVACSLAP